MLEQDIANSASNPDQLLPPPANSRISLPVLDAQYQLRSLHRKVRQSIRQRQSLADAGEAVAKINHDLHNMLSSILLVTEQLKSSADPQVALVVPVVIRATEQATELCQNMLDYLSELPHPAPESLYMPAVMDELSATAEIRLHYSGPDNLFSDRMMLFRFF